MSSIRRGIALIALAAVSTLPYLWMVAQAFRDRSQITASPPSFVFDPTLENFASSYSGQSVGTLLISAFIISTGTVALSLLAGAPAAYYFARTRTYLTKQLFLLVLSTRMASPIALCLPMFVVFGFLGLRGTYVSVVLTESIFNIAFVVWFLESAISSTPPEIEMAAQVDGRSRLGALLDVVLPVNIPALGAAAAFVFLFSWNEYLIASLLSNSLTRPVTPALPGFIAQATSQWGEFCAVALIASLPPIIIALFARRYFARAFSIGSIADA